MPQPPTLTSDYPSYQKSFLPVKRQLECDDADESSLKISTFIAVIFLALIVAVGLETKNGFPLQATKLGFARVNEMIPVDMGFSRAHVDAHKNNSNSNSNNNSYNIDDNKAAARNIHILETLQALQRSIDGTVYFPHSVNFDQASHVWAIGTVHTSPPWVVIEVQHEPDVQITLPVLAFLKQTYNFPFRIRSGGHNKAGYSTVAEGAVLSLVRMNHIALLPLPNHGTASSSSMAVARMGPAVLVEQFAAELLEKQGFGGVIGFCGKVAESGFILGGGLGLQSRMHGLGADNVESFRIVLVDGTVHHASKDRNRDLFWALRGAGGGNFGVVTEIDYYVHRAIDRWVINQIKFDDPITLATFLFRLGQEEPHLPGNVLAMHDEPNTATFFYSGRDEVEMAAGPSLLHNLVQRLVPQNAAVNVTHVDMKWSDSYRMQFVSWGTETWAARCWYGFMMPENNTNEIWRDIIQHISKGVEESSPYLAPDVELWGGRIRDTPWNATAFPHRSTVFNVGVLLNIPVGLEDGDEIFQEHVAKVNTWWPQVQQYLTGSYVNYPTVSLTAGDYARVYWGENLPRLVDIKRRVDPHNAFQFPMSVPTEL